jgi:hypothetical protein
VKIRCASTHRHLTQNKGEFMGSKSIQIQVCLNKNDKTFLEETNLEEILDVEGRKDSPLRGENVRKSIERHMERKQLKKNIVDFDFNDDYEEH